MLLIIIFSSHTYVGAGSPRTRSGTIDFSIEYLIEPVNNINDPNYNRKVSYLEPGAEGLFSIVVSNEGEINDTIEISIEDPISIADLYFVESNETNIELDLVALKYDDDGNHSSETITLKVSISSQADVGTEFNINVTGVSKYSRVDLKDPVVETDTLNIIVGKEPFVELGFNYPRYAMPANSEITVILNLEYIGYTESAMVSLQVEGLKSGWIIDVPQEPFMLLKDEPNQIDITVKSPSRRTETMVVDFVCNEVNGNNRSNSSSVTFIIGVERKFLIGFLDPLTPLENGNTSTFRFFINNTGNVPEDLSITFDCDRKGVVLTVEETNGSVIQQIRVDLDKNITLVLRIEVNESARGGDLTAQILFSSSTYLNTLQVPLEILPIHNATIECLFIFDYYTVKWNSYERRDLRFSFENNGNMRQIFEVRIAKGYDPYQTDLPPFPEYLNYELAWISRSDDPQTELDGFDNIDVIQYEDISSEGFHPLPKGTQSFKIELDPGSRVVFDFGGKIIMNRDLLFHKAGALVAVLDDNELMLDTCFLDISVQFPAVNPSFPKSFDPEDVEALPGDIVEIPVYLSNAGSCCAKNVEIFLYVDGVLYKNFTISILNISENKDIIFKWIAEPGLHNFTEKTRCAEGLVIGELMENTREYSITIKDVQVEEDIDEDKDSSWWIPIFAGVGAVILFVLIVVMILFIIFVKRGKEEKEKMKTEKIDKEESLEQELEMQIIKKEKDGSADLERDIDENGPGPEVL